MAKGSLSPTTSVGRPLSKTAASKQRCPWTEPADGLGTTIRSLTRPKRATTVPLSPANKTIVRRRCRFQRLALDDFARHSCREDHVGKVGKSRSWVRLDK